MAKDEKKEKKTGVDKTSANGGGKAPKIDYPERTDISPISMKEKYKIQLHFDEKTKMEKAMQLVKILQEITALEDKKKAQADAINQEIKGKEVLKEDLTEWLAKGYEEKEVVCEVERDFGKQVRRYMYKGTCYGEEKLKASDHQYDLDHAAKQNNAGPLTVVKSPLPAGFIQKLKKGDWIETAKGSIVELTEDDLLTLKADQVKGYASEKQIADTIAAKKKPKK